MTGNIKEILETSSIPTTFHHMVEMVAMEYRSRLSGAKFGEYGLAIDDATAKDLRVLGNLLNGFGAASEDIYKIRDFILA